MKILVIQLKEYRSILLLGNSVFEEGEL